MFRTLSKLSSMLFLAVSGLVFADCATTFEVGIGYRRDDIEWHNRAKAAAFVTTAGKSIPETFARSKLSLRDLDIFLVSGKARSIDECYYFRMSGDYGWIVRGESRERVDFRQKGVDIAHSTVHNKADEQFVADVSAALGYPFITGCCDELLIAPLIGYSWHTQHVRVTDKNLISSQLTAAQIAQIPIVPETESTSTTSPNTNVTQHSKYEFSWYAPYIGVDLIYRLEDDWNIYGEFEYHFFGQAKRHRDSSIGFLALDHHSKREQGQGFVGTVGTDYTFCCDWYVGLSVDLKYWSSNKDHDKVKWTSWGMNLNLGYIF